MQSIERFVVAVQGSGWQNKNDIKIMITGDVL
jgi:hypothetical protein